MLLAKGGPMSVDPTGHRLCTERAIRKTGSTQNPKKGNEKAKNKAVRMIYWQRDLHAGGGAWKIRAVGALSSSWQQSLRRANASITHLGHCDKNDPVYL
jgi:hypothetical protein